MRRTLDSFCFVLEKCSMGHETTPVPETPNERHRRVAHAFDETLQTNIERRTGGLSPIALSLAQMDWALHMLGSPAQQGVLAQRALELAVQAWDNLRTPPDTEVTEKDGRFADKGWNQWPYNVFKEGFKAYDSWWRDVADMPSGLNKHHQHMVNFFAGQAAWFCGIFPAWRQKSRQTGRSANSIWMPQQVSQCHGASLAEPHHIDTAGWNF